MKSLVTGIIVFIFGYVLIALGVSLFGGVNDSMKLIIVLSVLYLSSIVGGSTIAILEEIRNIKK